MKKRLITLVIGILTATLCLIAGDLQTHYPFSSLKERIELIKQQSGIEISYDFKLVSNIQVAALDFESSPTTDEVLKKSLSNTSLEIKKIDEKTYVIVKKTTVAENKNKKLNPGKIEGSILDENGEPLVGATIFLVEIATGAVTDMNGFFSLRVPPRSYTVEVRFISYRSQQLTNVIVQSGETTPLVVKMQPDENEIGEIMVSAEYNRETAQCLYAVQKKTVSFTDGISASQIKQLPASNVAEVLKKVSGVTIQKGKFVTVRGMSERYNNMQLNGSSLPSTEPNRRNFSFDIIPSNLVQNVVVHKTFTPDLPGEFSGGLVRVNTIDVPTKTFFTISAGSGIHTQSTGKSFHSTKRYSGDYFGGDKDRIWKENGFNVTNYFNNYSANAATDDDAVTLINAEVAKIPNNWGLREYTAQPDQSYDLAFGTSIDLKKGNTLGAVVSGTYRHKDRIAPFEARFRENDGDTTAYACDYKFTTAIGGIANVTFKHSDKHKITCRNLYNRRFSHITTEQEISDLDGSGSEYEYYSSVLTNILWQTRLEGEHKIYKNHLKFTWLADYNKLIRRQPDDRSSNASIEEWEDDGRYELKYDLSSTFPNDGLFLYNNELQEKRKNVGADLQYKFQLFGQEQKIKTGYYGTFRETEYEQLGLKILERSSNNELRGMEDSELAAPENFLNNKLYTKYAYSSGNTGGQGEEYTGEQQIHASYIMADVHPVKWLNLIGGVRCEKSIMDVSTLTRFDLDDGGTYWTDTTSRYTETEFLPAITAIVNITQDINFRAAYSKTLTRADFKERSYYKYWDVTEKAEMMGNGGLEQSYTRNYDVRLEWYPNPGEVISVSAFYKDFVKPVEMISYAKASGGFRMMYFNLDNSVLKGIEAEVRKSLGFIASQKWLSNLYLSANTSIMKGDVTYNSEELEDLAQGLDYNEETGEGGFEDQKRSRPLQGLSPYVINAGLSYQGEKFGASANYNRTGKKIVLAGFDYESDEYEAPDDNLDIQLRYKLLNNKMQIKLNITDVFAKDYIKYRNKNKDDVDLTYDNDPEGLDYNEDYDWTLKRSKMGTGYSFSVSYTF